MHLPRFLLVVAGATFALAPRSAGAQNLLANPTFDQNLAGWTASNYNPQWNAADASGSSHSGSVRAMVPGGPQQGGPVLYQCVPVTAGVSYAFSLKARVQQLDDAVGGVWYFAATNCDGAPLSSTPIPVREGQPNAWLTVHHLSVAPGGAVRARIEIYATTQFVNVSTGAAHTAFYDDAYFGPPAPTSCIPGPETLCLDHDPGDGRFPVRASYSTVQSGGLSGNGDAIPLSSLGVNRGGLFWFFEPANPEVLVKVLDTCSINDYSWVYIAAGTNVGVNLFIGDTDTGAVVLFHNPDLGAFPPIQNIYAVPCE